MADEVTIGKEKEKAEAAAKLKADAEAKAQGELVTKLKAEADAATLKVTEANTAEISTLKKRFETVQASLETGTLVGIKVLDDMRADVKGLLATLSDNQHKTLADALEHHKSNNPVKASNKTVGIFLNWYDADLSKLWSWFNA